MLLNLYVIVGALVIGVITGGAARAALRRSQAPAMVIVVGAFGASCVLNVVAGIGALFLTGPDAFTLMHVTYLWAVLALPVAAAIALSAGLRRLGLASTSALLAGLLLAPLGVYMTHIEPFWLRVDRVELPTDSVATGFRIGVLSDLQTTEIGAYETDAIERLIALDPDVVLVPGDLYQIEPENWQDKVPEFTAAIDKLTDRVPLVVLVSGDTDSVSGLRSIVAGTPAVVLDNESLDVEIAGNRVHIVGITLYGSELAADTVIDALPAADADMTILLSHRPDEISRIIDTPVDLVVAGHTHGGQIALPGLGPPLTLSSVPRTVGAGGLHELSGSPIYVSTGVGRERGNAPQMRLGVRPSIGLIEVGS